MIPTEIKDPVLENGVDDVVTLLKSYVGIVFKLLHPLNKYPILVTLDVVIPGASIKDWQE